MAKFKPSILSLEFFCKNSIYLRVRLRESFVNPQLLKQLVVFKIKEHFLLVFTVFFTKLVRDYNHDNNIY